MATALTTDAYYVQALDATGFDYGTLRNDKYSASRFELSRRRDNLSFAHHSDVAHLEPENQDIWLDRASAPYLSDWCRKTWFRESTSARWPA